MTFTASKAILPAAVPVVLPTIVITGVIAQQAEIYATVSRWITVFPAAGTVTAPSVSGRAVPLIYAWRSIIPAAVDVIVMSADILYKPLLLTVIPAELGVKDMPVSVITEPSERGVATVVKACIVALYVCAEDL